MKTNFEDEVNMVSRHSREIQEIGSLMEPEPERATILLISADTGFYEALRRFANKVGRLVVRTECLAAVPILQAVRPRVVLLDLDLPQEAVCETAEAIMRDQSCPPLILLTARREQFDMRAATRSGSVLPKSESPLRLLEMVDETLAMRSSGHAERNAIQKTLIQSLKPHRWTVTVGPAHRFWGINE
jgi:DNA-binding NarL/FixJ family response regulator